MRDMILPKHRRKGSAGDGFGGVTNLAPYLPALLTIDQKPMSLVDHFPFEETFSTEVPSRIVHRSSRQIGKTRSVIGRLILECALVSGKKVLVVTPLQEQSDTLSATIFKPMVMDSPLGAMLVSSDTSSSVRRWDFPNRSIIFFSYAGVSTERIRSKTSSVLFIDEAQNMDGTLVPVINQCLSASKEPVTWISGTSKTKDTFLEEEWLDSSQGIWHTKCDACGFTNIAALEPDGHLLSMIGPYREDISEDRPGTTCHRCKSPIRPRYGKWVHRYPERLKSSVGFYAPQVLFPIHNAIPEKWRIFLGCMRGAGGYTQAKFYNECLGEAFDQAYKLVSIDDLRNAATMGPNTEAEAVSRSRRYPMVVMGVDWGGGGDDGVSRTKGAVAGLAADGTAEVFFGFQFEPSTDRVAEAREIIRLARLCNASLISHDIGGGIGTASEAAMTYMGWPQERLIPMAYQGMTGGGMVEYRPPQKGRQRGYYVMHKAQTLQFLCMAIRQMRVRFFKYDYADKNEPGLLHDFLALVEDKVDTPTGGTYRIRRSSKTVSDDFSAAVNYATAALWEYSRAWPSLTTAGKIGPEA